MQKIIHLNNTPYKSFHILPTLPYNEDPNLLFTHFSSTFFFTPTSESESWKLFCHTEDIWTLSEDEDSEEVSESELQNRLAQIWVPEAFHNLAKWWQVDKKEIGLRVYSLWKLSGSYESWELRIYNCGSSETNQVRGWIRFLVRQDTPELCAFGPWESITYRASRF